MMVPKKKQKGKAPVLVVYDDDKEASWTLAVGDKGPTESCVRWSGDRLEDSGYIGNLQLSNPIKKSR